MRDREGRVDLTALPLVTIDGETAKDFDDAVYCERKGKGFRLIVAIADVSHYVRDGDALDRDARERGTSVYFPRRVIPMLPEALSNELCSLKPDVDRLCMVCDMDVTAQGAIAQVQVLPGGDAFARAPHLHAGVELAVATPTTRAARRRSALLPQLTQSLRALSRAARRRAKRAAPSTSTRVEMQLEFDVQGKIVRIVPVVRNDAHKLIEECMLAANVCTAEFLAAAQAPGALSRARRSDAGEARARCAIFSRAARCRSPAATIRRQPTTRSSCCGSRIGPTTRCCRRCCCARCSRRVPPGQRRPLRPLVRGLRALHVADPPLSRPARPSRDQGRARRHAQYKPGGRRGPSSACIAR